ncbi:formylglycine-generating enzyme family protein [Luteolibacter pohnpeiensis]|uniref:Formylglycine-generating enzyme family protein n=1 Tax=Luteolibacter pohnpeiensis TaxID=454153 RepID=A0A934S7S1_9BACT|nr:formylglycine-generating enzyme family protein [Luteolibacter pohnpeiensis]MBK1882870.1 formylglycine-generating enzyme family protein [Luteolibacter pohnpeiensis]
MKLPLFLAASAVACAADLPNPQLLPTTRAIHEKIAAQADPAAADMKTYTEKAPLASDAAYEMIAIPGGEFVMGSPDSEPGHKPDEGPQHKVKVDPFWMGKLEMTWDLYRPFMENGKSRNKDGTLNRDSDIYSSEAPEIKEGETLDDTITQPTPPYMPMHFEMGQGYSKEYPAVGMTQHAASKFCEWLSAQTGHFYRLPTEAEWEYACRAGTTTTYSFGDDVSKLGDYAWFAENSEFQYQKVGTKKPNAWGLYDMLGNVSELVLDQYEADAYAKMKDGAANPWIPAANRYPTSVRGGNWDADPEMLRCAARLGTSAKLKARDPQLPKSIWFFTDAPWLGFRIVRPLKTPDVEEMHRYWNMGPGPTE